MCWWCFGWTVTWFVAVELSTDKHWSRCQRWHDVDASCTAAARWNDWWRSHCLFLLLLLRSYSDAITGVEGRGYKQQIDTKYVVSSVCAVVYRRAIRWASTTDWRRQRHHGNRKDTKNKGEKYYLFVAPCRVASSNKASDRTRCHRLRQLCLQHDNRLLVVLALFILLSLPCLCPFSKGTRESIGNK